MNTDEEVKAALEKLKTEDFSKFRDELDNTDFGIYLPTYTEGGVVKLMPEGYSQNETDLEVTIEKSDGGPPPDSQVVAWMGNPIFADSTCSHPGTGTTHCKHCTKHGTCKHCTGHPRGSKIRPDDDLLADELDYDKVITVIPSKDQTINELAKYGFGLSLLHGHNSQYKFTKLPEGYISVVSGTKTYFRPESTVAEDPTFVPNTWRFTNGELKVAGGFSNQ